MARLQIAGRQIAGLVVGLALAAPAAGETIDRVLAVVAGQLIMLSDVVAVRELGIVAPAGGGDQVGSVLSKLIDRELMLAEVDRYAPPEPEIAEIDRDVAAVRARFPSDKAFTAVLAPPACPFDPPEPAFWVVPACPHAARTIPATTVTPSHRSFPVPMRSTAPP